MSPVDLSNALVQPGRASIPYLDRYSADRPLVLECFRPRGHSPDNPVVIVQHGMSRNARNTARHGSRLLSGTVC